MASPKAPGDRSSRPENGLTVRGPAAGAPPAGKSLRNEIRMSRTDRASGASLRVAASPVLHAARFHVRQKVGSMTSKLPAGPRRLALLEGLALLTTIRSAR